MANGRTAERLKGALWPITVTMMHSACIGGGRYKAVEREIERCRTQENGKILYRDSACTQAQL